MTTNAGMRFGFMLFPYDRFKDVEEIVEVTRRADELGYYAVEMPEHLLPPQSATKQLRNEAWYDGVTIASYIAASTRNIRLFMNVLVFPYHHPVRLAKSLATLDVVSRGRVLCGVGAGWMKSEFERLSIPFEDRSAMTDEYLQAVKKLWTSESPSFRGKFVSFADVSFLPKPIQKPHIPLLIGGSGPRPWRRAIQFGDGWTCMRGSMDEIADGIRRIRTGIEAAGRDGSGLHFGMNAINVGADEDLGWARRHAGDQRPQSSNRTPEELLQEIEACRSIGLNYLSLAFSWRTADDLLIQLERFATNVMSQIEQKWG
jgi:probable F420-dependent oxidoreductase